MASVLDTPSLVPGLSAEGDIDANIIPIDHENFDETVKASKVRKRV